MSGYRQDYCPIVRASEVLAERWTPIIVRNLLLGCETFNEIAAGVPGISDTLLSQRLRSLERHGVLERQPNPSGRGSLYRLTPAGQQLQHVCDALGSWGARWLDVAPKDLDPGILLWAVAKTMNPRKFPPRRVVIRFDLRDAPQQRFWMVVQRPEPELCRKHPGFEEDLVFTTDTKGLMNWHTGRVSIGEALRQGVIEIDGPRDLVHAFGSWGGQSPYGRIPKA